MPEGLNRLFTEKEIIESPSQDGMIPITIKVTTTKIMISNLSQQSLIISDNLFINILKCNIFR